MEGGNILEFLFSKFRSEGEYFSEIQKDGHFDEKLRKRKTTPNSVKNGRTRDEKYEASYRGNNTR